MSNYLYYRDLEKLIRAIDSESWGNVIVQVNGVNAQSFVLSFESGNSERTILDVRSTNPPYPTR
jgi:hypothetical protein